MTWIDWSADRTSGETTTDELVVDADVGPVRFDEHATHEASNAAANNTQQFERTAASCRRHAARALFRPPWRPGPSRRGREGAPDARP
jgi:hypothetical protein